METELEIAFHHMEPSPYVEERVRTRVDRLEKRFGRLTCCRVVVDAPHQRHDKGNHYSVRIEAHVPSAVFSVDREPGDVNAHEDVYVAIRDAFDAMERKVRRWKETHSGRPEAHAERLQGRIAELLPEQDHGQIALTDGRLVYFHRNSVIDGDFGALSEGDAVELSLHAGDSEKGPHASGVRAISDQRFVDRPR